MRPRKVRVLHDGKEFYLLDTGRNERSRVLTLIKKCDRELADGAPVVVTDQGDYVAVARWRGGEIAVETGNEELREPFAKIVTRYLDEFRTGRARTGITPWYFLSVDRKALFGVSKAQPYGLAVEIYSDAKTAARAAATRQSIEGRTITVEETGDLSDFLEARAAEGFAGGILDDRDPIYFCADSAGNPKFLKLTLDPESGEIEHFLLDDLGNWKLYEGQEEIVAEIEIDQDAFDEHMVDRLGSTPFLGYHEGIRFHRFVRKEPGADPNGLVLVHCEEDGEGDLVCPIFHDLELAEAFREEHVQEPVDLVPIDDLAGFLDAAQREGRAVRVQPHGHRARGGVMWTKDGTIYLESFSGMWSSRDGHDFSLLPLPEPGGDVE